MEEHLIDQERQEDIVGGGREEWTEDHRKLLIGWRETIVEYSQLHEKAGTKFEKYQDGIGTINYIIPLLMTFMQVVFSNLIIEKTIVNIIIGLIFFLIAIIAYLNKFYNFGTRSALHFQFSARHYNLMTRIDLELHKQDKFRTPVDLFLNEIRVNMNELIKNGPIFT